MTVRILTDSTCDLPAEVVNQLEILVLPIYIHVGERDYLDGIDITREEFYSDLPHYPVHPGTAVPSPAKFHALYDALADAGADEVISIHISSSLSGIIDVARTAAQETTSTKVTVFDSHQLSLGTGFLVKTAADLAQQGLTASEILPRLEEQIKRTHVSAALSTLTYLRKSGRMNGVISALGELLSIKPILTMFDGKAIAEKVRTQQKAMGRLAEMVRSFAPLERIAFLHSGAVEAAHALKAMLQDVLPDQEIWFEMINPVLGAHIGPQAVGFACVSRGEESSI